MALATSASASAHDLKQSYISTHWPQCLVYNEDTFILIDGEFCIVGPSRISPLVRTHLQDVNTRGIVSYDRTCALIKHENRIKLVCLVSSIRGGDIAITQYDGDNLNHLYFDANNGVNDIKRAGWWYNGDRLLYGLIAHCSASNITAVTWDDAPTYANIYGSQFPYLTLREYYRINWAFSKTGRFLYVVYDTKNSGYMHCVYASQGGTWTEVFTTTSKHSSGILSTTDENMVYIAANQCVACFTIQPQQICHVVQFNADFTGAATAIAVYAEANVTILCGVVSIASNGKYCAGLYPATFRDVVSLLTVVVAASRAHTGLPSELWHLIATEFLKCGPYVRTHFS